MALLPTAAIELDWAGDIRAVVPVFRWKVADLEDESTLVLRGRGACQLAKGLELMRCTPMENGRPKFDSWIAAARIQN